MNRRCNRCLETDGVVRMWGAVHWCRQCAIDAGSLGRRALARYDSGGNPDAFTPAVLKAIAAGPIMDSNALYLPAGKLSEAEFQSRQSTILLDAQP